MQQVASTDLEQRSTVPFRSTSGGVVFWLLAACMMLYLVGPLVYFLFVLPWSAVSSTLSDPDAVPALITSAMSATIATAFMTLFGVPLGYVLAPFTCRWSFRQSSAALSC